MSPLFESFNGDFNGKQGEKDIYPQKTLSDDLSENLRLLYNSYVAKVYIESGVIFWFPLPEVPFLTYPKVSIIPFFNAFKKMSKSDIGL